MYMGVKNHHQLPRVRSYEDAQKALAVWQSKPRRGKQVAQVLDLDGSIAFRLYATDVVVWHPDNSVDIDNYGTLTTSGFAEQFVPDSIRLHFPTARRGLTGGANTIGYWAGDERMICQGDVVRFCEVQGLLPGGAGCWVPDEDTCYDLSFPARVGSAKDVRTLTKDYNLTDFAAWLEHAPRLLNAGGNPIVHLNWNFDDCSAALKARDWRVAAATLPLIEDTRAYGRELKPLPITTWPNNHVVTLGSLTKLKLALIDDAGLIDTITVQTLPRKDYDKHMTLVRSLRSIDMARDSWGPKT